jgi:hypothetical protein
MIDLIAIRKNYDPMIAIVGIDPGLQGGIVVLDSGRELLEAHTMPTIGNLLNLDQLSQIIRGISINYKAHVFIEQVSAMPKQGVSSMFKFGRVFGVLEGMLATVALATEYVRPQEWQKNMHQGIEKSLNPKERSLIAAQRLFPTLDLKRTPKCTTQHDGLIDALLIAEYGRRKLQPVQGAA